MVMYLIGAIMLMTACSPEEDMLTVNNSSGAFRADGSSNALFSVSDSTQVRFSRGNLQYQASTGTWRFAEHQYDRIGNDNANVSPTYSGWIDLYAWGTSGWVSGAICYQPWDTEYHNPYYTPGGLPENNLTGSCAEADWAWHNAISNGGNQPHLWRTMTREEWKYMLLYRPNASDKFGAAIIGDNPAGLVILPDNWVLPDSVEFFPYSYNRIINHYSLDKWNRMENAGAIFLPPVGERHNYDVLHVSNYNTACKYWTATNAGDGYAYLLSFCPGLSTDYILDGCNSRAVGYAVRPVMD